MTTPAATDEDVLHDDLGWTLGVVFRAQVRLTGDVVAEVPGGPRGFQVLRLAARSPSAACQEAGQGAIARQLGVDRTVMTYLVDDLVNAGLLERVPSASDRRQRILVLTAKGRGAVRRLHERITRVEEHLLAGLSPDERAAFRSMLTRLAARAETEDPVHGDACTLAELVSD